mmetsp:Transcript_13708/g.54179  ORF Transcript_13708/g.54179 Transcript_13708/m.54179 type:complete len:209 (-) Transcript_13708:6755-7381(-)
MHLRTLARDNSLKIEICNCQHMDVQDIDHMHVQTMKVPFEFHRTRILYHDQSCSLDPLGVNLNLHRSLLKHLRRLCELSPSQYLMDNRTEESGCHSRHPDTMQQILALPTIALGSDLTTSSYFLCRSPPRLMQSFSHKQARRSHFLSAQFPDSHEPMCLQNRGSQQEYVSGKPTYLLGKLGCQRTIHLQHVDSTLGSHMHPNLTWDPL